MHKVIIDSTIGNKNLVDHNFRERLNKDLNYCGLDQDEQKGLLFIMGASLNYSINNTPLGIDKYFRTDKDLKTNFTKLINLYSDPKGDFSNYGELNDYSLMKTIYSYNVVLYDVLGSSQPVDTFLRTTPSGKDTIGKTSLDEDLVQEFQGKKFNVDTVHKLNKTLFRKLGKQLSQVNFSNTKSYEAGYAYFCMMSSMDMNGTGFLIANTHQFLSPLFDALMQYPIIHLFYPKEFEANHIFTSIFQMLYKGGDPKIVIHIHKFHQVLFYDEKSSRLRTVWDFKNEERGLLISQVLHNSAGFRTFRGAVDFRQDFLNFEGYYAPSLKDQTLDRQQLFNTIVQILNKKYNIDIDEIINKGTTGDFMQFLAIIFYETCLHAMILKKVELVE